MRLVTLVSGLVLFAAPALAEPVTYHLVGTVSAVTDGQLNTLDLRGTFPVGHTFTVDVTIERSTLPVIADEVIAIYNGAGTALTFTIDGYTCTGAEFNACSISNDVPPIPEGLALGTLTDEFTYNASQLIAPTIGNATIVAFTLDFLDVQGTALSSLGFPRPLPALMEFETKAFSVGYTDAVAQRNGVVFGDFGTATTPALGTSWGRIKGFYR